MTSPPSLTFRSTFDRLNEGLPFLGHPSANNTFGAGAGTGDQRLSFRVSVRHYDFTAQFCPLTSAADDKTDGVSSASYAGSPHYQWRTEDKILGRGAEVFIAADVIFDDDVSEAFCDKVLALLSAPGPIDHPPHSVPAKVLYMTVEKRVVFTLQDMRPVAHAFLYCMQELQRRGLVIEWLELEAIPQMFEYGRDESRLVLLRVTCPHTVTAAADANEKK